MIWEEKGTLSQFLKKAKAKWGTTNLSLLTYLRAELMLSCNMQAEKISGSASAPISVFVWF